MASRSVLDRRRLASRRPSDRRRRLAAVGLIVLLSSALLSILAYGYAIELVLPHSQLVVRIGEVEYTRGDVLKLLRARQATVELLGGRMDRRSDVIAAVLTLVENEIISQSARTLRNLRLRQGGGGRDSEAPSSMPEAMRSRSPAAPERGTGRC